MNFNHPIVAALLLCAFALTTFRRRVTARRSPAAASRTRLAFAAAFVFICLCSSVANASFIRTAWKDVWTGLPLTNSFVMVHVGDIRSDGTATPQNLPIRVTPAPDGQATNQLPAGNYYATNANSAQAFYFRAPEDSGPTVYSFTQPGVWKSGGNYFVTDVITNGAGGSVTFNIVTNALGYTPPQGSILTNSFDPTNSAANMATTILTIVTNKDTAGLGIATNMVAAQGAASTNDTIARVTAALTIVTNKDAANLGIMTNVVAAQGAANTNDAIARVLAQGTANTNDAAARVTAALVIVTNRDAQVLLTATNSFDPTNSAANMATTVLATVTNMDTVTRTIITNLSGGAAFIANSNGRGTNTILTNAVVINVTNLYAANSTNGNEQITNLTVGKLTALNDADFSGRSLTNSGGISLTTGSYLQLFKGWIVGGNDSTDDAGTGIYIGPSAPRYLMYNEIGSVNIGTSNDIAATVSSKINYATIVGGARNIIGVGGDFSTILGGQGNGTIGKYSFISGFGSTNIYQSCWVWSDYPHLMVPTSTNQFIVGALGGFGINTNAPPIGGLGISGSLNLNGQSLPSFNNLTNWATISTNLLTGGLSTNGLATTNYAVVQSGTATNVSAYGFLSIGGGLTYIISTNVLGVTNCAYTNVNGTYNNYGTAGAYTNIFDARWTLAFGAPNNYSFRSNGVIIYLGGSAFVGTNYAAQGTAATPTPIVYIGGYLNPFGFIKNPSDVLQGTNDPNGIIIAPKGSLYTWFTNGAPKMIFVNTNNASGWY